MQHKKRKKIYSEQLLQIHEDSKKIHPGKEIYATGYVIELKKDCYFAGFQDGKILCRSFEYARYFSNTHSAEQFVKEYLGYAGLRCNLCKVAWGLAVHGLEPGWKENLKPYKNQGDPAGENSRQAARLARSCGENGQLCRGRHGL